MLIRKISLRNFMSHESSDIRLPDKGVVLVTGKNGSGKSSLAEAIAVASWGKTLRGASPWVADKDGSVELEIILGKEERAVKRDHKKSGKVNLTFSPSKAAYSTTTKAQLALTSIIGDFDTWRRCSIFSSQDAGHFTLSTDAERKRLLENLLGLDRFDEALAECKKDRREVSDKISFIEREMYVANSRLDLLRDSLKDNQESYAKASTNPYRDISSDDIIDLEESIENTKAKYKKIQAEQRDLQLASADLRGLLANDERKLVAIRSESCSKCGQSIDKEYADKLEKELLSDISKVKESINKQGELYKIISKNLEANEIALDKSRRILAEKKSELKQHLTNKVMLDHLDTVIGRIEEEEIEIEQSIKDYFQEKKKCLYREAVLENTEIVLGTKGVRAHILGSALKALEITCNKWLKKISGDGISLSISPYTQKKSGGNKEAIALNIRGIAGGEGYKAASGGQRRRIDVALILALSELAQASGGYTSGTIFFDEVFDSLDSEGIETISQVIEEMGKSKPVIIISHSEELSSQLSPSVRYIVDNGRVS